MDNLSQLLDQMPSDGELSLTEAQRLAELEGVPFEQPPLPNQQELVSPYRPFWRSLNSTMVALIGVTSFVMLCGLAILSGESPKSIAIDTITPALPTQTSDPTLEYLRHIEERGPVLETIGGVEMVLVPPYCNSESICIEYPFWIDRYEVSNQQAGISGSGIFPQHPYVNVSQVEAEAYCEQRGGRLPTAQEWEYAAGGVEQWAYPWANRFDGSNANFCDRQCELENRDEHYNDGYELVAKTTRFEKGASWVGALNMSGNVAEWTQTSDSNPEMAEVRGGSWASDKSSITTQSSEWIDMSYSDDRIGFRCVIGDVDSD